jgi:SAM-dependent methyltransferase
MTLYAQFAAYYAQIFPFSETLYAFLRQHLPAPPARCLDVGCGPGHVSVRLAEDGFDAVGVDLDPAMIAHARQHARSHAARATFHRMNMLDVADLVDAAPPFDGAYCIGNTAAHLNPAQFAQFLGAMRRVLRPEAPWIVQVMNWDYVLTQERMTLPVIENEGVAFYRAYRDISEARVTFATRLEVDGAVVFEDAVPLYPLRSAQVVAAHAEAGFAVRHHVGSYTGAPFDPDEFSANIFVFKGNE